MTTLPYLTSDQILAAISPLDSVRALQHALRGGVDPDADAPRSVVDVTHGQLLLMPAEGLGYVGTKIASVAPDNPAAGRPRIQAVYVLMDATTLTPVALLDGNALTTRRTAGVSAVAVDALAAPRASRLVVFGSGPQAKAHIEAVRAVRPTVEHVVIAARDAYKAEGLAAWAVEQGMQARLSQAMPLASALPEADIVVTATSAREPLFDGSLIGDETVVVAVGSHEPELRELPADLLGRSTVVVEQRATALREAGDVVLAIADGALRDDALIDLRDLVLGDASIPTGRPRIFKSVGMSWQDVVVAAEAYRRATPRKPAGALGGIARSRRPNYYPAAH